MIQRYDAYNEWGVPKDDNGDYVLYDDHIEALDAALTVTEAMVERAWASLAAICGVEDCDEYQKPIPPRINNVEKDDMRAALEAAFAPGAT